MTGLLSGLETGLRRKLLVMSKGVVDRLERWIDQNSDVETGNVVRIPNTFRCATVASTSSAVKCTSHFFSFFLLHGLPFILRAPCPLYCDDDGYEKFKEKKGCIICPPS